MSYSGPPDLHSDRINFGTPFEFTGVNCTEAITIAGDEGTPKKAYTYLFTYAYIVKQSYNLYLAEDLHSETSL